MAMNWNDLPLHAASSASSSAGVTGQPSTGVRETGSNSSFEQELRRQHEADSQPESRTTMAATPVATGARPDSQAVEPATGDTPADWLALLDGMRAMAKAQPPVPVAAPVPEPIPVPVAAPAPEPAAPAPEPVTVPVVTATPVAVTIVTPAPSNPDELVAAAGNTAATTVEPVGTAANETDRETSEPIPDNPPDGAQPPLMFGLAPLAQPAAPTIEADPATTTAGRESATSVRLDAGPRQAWTESSDPGELDAMTARALADAAPQLKASTASPTSGADTQLDPLAQALPGTTSLAPESARLPTEVPVQRHVATPVGQRGWDQAISQQVSWLVRDQLQSASLSLNPPHLGPVQVTLQLDQQQATVQFVSAAPEVRKALEEALPVLRAMLGEAGIALGQADVGSRQPERQQPAFQRSARRAGVGEDEPVEVVLQPRSSGGGLLNLYA